MMNKLSFMSDAHDAQHMVLRSSKLSLLLMLKLDKKDERFGNDFVTNVPLALAICKSAVYAKRGTITHRHHSAYQGKCKIEI